MLICLMVSLLACTEDTSDVDVDWGDSNGSEAPPDPFGEGSTSSEVVDTDGDGLTDAEEEALGSDPTKVDTDGDGWDDGVEESYYTDPADRNDHPYTGGWPIDSCRNDLQPTGMAEGDVINDVALLDQYGEEIRLHDFCDHTVLIEHAGFSWGGCAASAPELEALYQEYKDDGLIVITAMTDGAAVDLQAWADTYGLTAPVTLDTAGLDSSFGIRALPAAHLISRGGVIHSLNIYASATLIEEALAFTP